MASTIQHPRILDDNFESDLRAGVLKPLLDLIQRDRDLIAEIRIDLLDVYCKGQRLISASPVRQGYCFKSHEKFWSEKKRNFGSAEEIAEFCRDTVPFIKQRIAEHGATGKEIEFEQLLIRANNLEELNTDYIAVDRQGVCDEGQGRMDVVGVYWPGNRRGSNDVLAPALIEVKYRQSGGVEHVADQIDRYYKNLLSLLPKFAKELENQLHQKAGLGLLSGLSKEAQAKIQRLKVADRVEDVRVVLALVDYNPRARSLDLDKLRRLPFANQIDVFHLGLGMWRGNSCFSL